MSKEKIEFKKVSLYPKQIKKVKRIALREYEGNFSFALRQLIDKHLEG